MSQSEWNRFLDGPYRPTCPESPIPLDVIDGIHAESTTLIRQGQIISATQQLEQLNGWLAESRQLRTLGVDPAQFVASVLVEEAETLARQGEVEAAVDFFLQAKEYDPSLDFDPQVRAEELAPQ